MATAKAKRGLAEFRGLHDRSVIVPAKLKGALEALEKEHGPEGWEYEGEFQKRAGISQTDLGKYREGFVDHIVETTGKAAKRVWFATKAAATKARNVMGG